MRYLIIYAINNNLSYGIWKLPGNETLGIILGNLVKTSFNQLTDHSFSFVSFNKSDYFSISPEISIYDNKLHHISNNSLNFTLFEDLLENNKTLNTQTGNKSSWYCTPDSPPDFETKESYIQQLKNSLAGINNREFEKIVAARKKTILLPQGFSPFDFFLKLIHNNSTAFISLFSSQETGTWIGASPELLLSSTGNQLETMALAGTRTMEQIDNNDSFTNKENTEQLLVAKFINEILVKKKLDFKELPTEIAEAGSLFHIKTLFTAKYIDPEIPGIILDLIHPTPAVCGYPGDKSLEFILKNEQFSRKFFSGYLGPYFNHQYFNFFVNIRCMEIRESTAVLYAGAGILKDSDPEKEWMETENKMNTLLHLMS
jgi:isochorismate synthase